MGGQIISKELAKSDLSSIYFNPYKEKTMPMWMQFKNALNQLPESEEDQMVQTARSTFSSLGKWLRSSTQFTGTKTLRLLGASENVAGVVVLISPSTSILKTRLVLIWISLAENKVIS